MDLESFDPFRVGSVVWQAPSGAFVLTVVCKATYVLLPGEARLARDQDPLNETDDHWNDDERRSLHMASDLAPFKLRADVFLTGHAYSPTRKPVSSLVTRLIVGEVDKTIEVHADRFWTQHGELVAGPPFTKMPLRYERAGGGPDTPNPVGLHADAPPDMRGRMAVPNLQPPGFYVARPEETPPPIGFGPVAPRWPERAAKLFRHALEWDHRLWSERPLPEDIDATFFNAAPRDQQVSEIRSNERLVLENLHVEHPRLVTNLPGLVPRAVVERPGAGAQEIRLQCDTLSIDTDRGVCNLLWRGLVALSTRDEPGRIAVTVEGVRQDVAVVTIVGGLELSPARPPSTGVENDGATTTLAPATGLLAPSLPFRECSPWAALAIATPAVRPPPRTASDGTGTIFGDVAGGGQVLPFAGSLEQPTVWHVEPPSKDAFLSATLPPPPVLGVRDLGPSFAQIAEPPHALDSTVPGVAPKPPHRIGPLVGTAEMVLRPSTAAPAVATPSHAVDTPEPLPLPLAEYPVQRCAAIAASIARRPTEEAEILKRHGLTPDRWSALDGHWASTLLYETERGREDLPDAYDDAYVAQLEAERGPISVVDYAHIVAATERGDQLQALAERDLPASAGMPIQRVWLRRFVEEPSLAEVARKELETARGAE